MRKCLLITILLISLALLFFGCSEDDNPTSGNNNGGSSDVDPILIQGLLSETCGHCVNTAPYLRRLADSLGDTVAIELWYNNRSPNSTMCASFYLGGGTFQYSTLFVGGIEIIYREGDMYSKCLSAIRTIQQTRPADPFDIDIDITSVNETTAEFDIEITKNEEVPTAYNQYLYAILIEDVNHPWAGMDSLYWCMRHRIPADNYDGVLLNLAVGSDTTISYQVSLPTDNIDHMSIIAFIQDHDGNYAVHEDWIWKVREVGLTE